VRAEKLISEFIRSTECMYESFAEEGTEYPPLGTMEQEYAARYFAIKNLKLTRNFTSPDGIPKTLEQLWNGFMSAGSWNGKQLDQEYEKMLKIMKKQDSKYVREWYDKVRPHIKDIGTIAGK